MDCLLVVTVCVCRLPFVMVPVGWNTIHQAEDLPPSGGWSLATQRLFCIAPVPRLVKLINEAPCLGSLHLMTGPPFASCRGLISSQDSPVFPDAYVLISMPTVKTTFVSAHGNTRPCSYLLVMFLSFDFCSILMSGQGFPDPCQLPSDLAIRTIGTNFGETRWWRWCWCWLDRTWYQLPQFVSKASIVNILALKTSRTTVTINKHNSPWTLYFNSLISYTAVPHNTALRSS